MHLPRRPKDPEGGVHQFRRALRCAGHPLAGVPLRRRHLRRLSVAIFVRASAPRQRSALVMIHPQEALLQEARAYQRSEAFAAYRKLPQVAEHRLARLMQLGVRQARYFGRAKTCFQLLLMAATVANLTLVASRVGLMRDRNHPKTSISTRISALLAMLIAICRVFAVPSLDRRLWNYPWTWVSATLLGHVYMTLTNSLNSRAGAETQV